MNDFDRLRFTPMRQISEAGRHWTWPWEQPTHSILQSWQKMRERSGGGLQAYFDQTPGIIANHITIILRQRRARTIWK